MSFTCVNQAVGRYPKLVYSHQDMRDAQAAKVSDNVNVND